jgi:hypothetical protein
VAGRIDDGRIAADQDAVAEPSLAQVKPDTLDRIEFRAVGREVEQGQVRGHLEVGADVPASPVENEHGVRAGRDRLRHFGQEDAHGHGRDLGQDQRHADIPLRADRTEEMGGGEALLAHAAWAHALLIPDVGRAPFLADPGFVLEPQLDPLGLGVPGGDLPDQGRQAFLNRSCTFGSVSGWTGRAFCQDRSRPFSSRSIPVSL